MSKIKVLVLPSDRTGVGKFRSVDPHVMLQNNHPDEFHVDIDYEPRVNDLNYWKQYDIVHFHRSIGHDYNSSVQILSDLCLISASLARHAFMDSCVGISLKTALGGVPCPVAIPMKTIWLKAIKNNFFII